MDMSDISKSQERPSEHSTGDASQAFRQELHQQLASSEVQQPRADVPETPQDLRVADLVRSLNAPGADWGKLNEKLRYTFVDEQNDNGVYGMRELADRVAQGTGLWLSVDRFRSSQSVYALYITDFDGRKSEIPITGRGSNRY